MKPLMKLKSFKKCQAGNVSVIFAAAILPILGTVGFAVDFSRGSEVRSQLAAAVDATALALAHSDVSLTEEQLQSKATELFNRNFKPGTAANRSSIEVNRETGALTVNGSAAFSTSFLRVLNVPTLDVTAKSKVVWGSDQKIEVVLALDNTGSMRGTKLAELKEAATALVDKLQEAALASGKGGQVQIGLVPFATTVRVDPNKFKKAKWIRRDDVSYQERECTRRKNRDGQWYDDCQIVTKTRAFSKAAWQGCIQDRDQDYDVTDAEPKTGTPSTLYPAIEACPSDERDLQTVLPLTKEFGNVRTAIDNMKAAGNTNVTIGLAWGMRLLSDKGPFAAPTQAQPQDEPSVGSNKKVKKYLILLTDGENTLNRFGNNHNGAIDARTKLACEEARKLGTIFSIRMIEGDEKLLKACASDPENYHDVKLASDLSTVFQAIGNEIANLRVAE